MTSRERFLNAFTHTPPDRPPVWIMRQAGRYLPEYREVRKRAGDFLTMCYTPEIAAEVTLQPIRRFGFDAAIVFSDILTPLVPMGTELEFSPAPHIHNPVREPDEIQQLRDARHEPVPAHPVQPAEERVLGARMMKDDDLWERFGKPDYAFAFHVSSENVAGKINVSEGSPYAGADTVDIIIHGVGAHGASPHAGKDPIVLGSQIVLALQTLVARELSPREPGVVTVGSFHSGTKHNIISDRAHLQLTVRNTNAETRRILLEGIERIAVNMGRVAGLPEDKLPEVIISEESVPPTVNDAALARRLKAAWTNAIGDAAVIESPTKGMGAEDFAYFVSTKEKVPGAYFQVGGTPQEVIDAAEAGGPPAIDWDAIRVAHAIPESGVELVPDDSFILEMGFERLNGVDFRKGCYVGQEVTARMKHKTELKKGLVTVGIDGSAAVGTEIFSGDKPVGTLFTQSGGKAIAYLRFDRAGPEMTAGDAAVHWTG